MVHGTGFFSLKGRSRQGFTEMLHLVIVEVNYDME